MIGYNDKCGCGKDALYETSTGSACNKYRRCATYDELLDDIARIDKENQELHTLLELASKERILFQKYIIELEDELDLAEKERFLFQKRLREKYVVGLEDD